MKHASGRPSAADTITAAIIARLEAGTRPWTRPWTGAPVSRPLRACGTPYRGINVLCLWMAAEAAGHLSPFWMTYRQASAIGGQVRKGERGTVAVFYRTYVRGAAGEEPDEVDGQTLRVLKSFTVFNACQVDGLSGRFFPEPRPLAAPEERDRSLDAFLRAVPARVRHGGTEAFYHPGPDEITMPEPGLFGDLDHYRAALAHELSHWTGHESRLARQMGGRFGSHAYAMEELVAVLSAAFLGAELGLPAAHLDRHASYLSSWLGVLKADSRAILSVAARAEEAASLLLRLGGRPLPGDLASGAEDPEAERLAA